MMNKRKIEGENRQNAEFSSIQKTLSNEDWQQIENDAFLKFYYLELNHLSIEQLISLQNEIEESQIDGYGKENKLNRSRNSISENADCKKDEGQSRIQDKGGQNGKGKNRGETSISHGSTSEKLRSSDGANKDLARNTINFRIHFRETTDKRSTGKKLTLHEQQDLEAEVIIELTEKNNLWTNNTNSIGEVFSSGHENNNYVDFKNKFVYKINNLFNSNTISALFDSNAIHNKLFPETAYEFVGYSGDKNRLTSIYPIFKQNLIEDAQLAEPKEIEAYMKSLGFKQITPMSYENKDYLVFDLYPRNVLKDSNCVIYVVDAEFKKLSKNEK